MYLERSRFNVEEGLALKVVCGLGIVVVEEIIPSTDYPSDNRGI